MQAILYKKIILAYSYRLKYIHIYTNDTYEIYQLVINIFTLELTIQHMQNMLFIIIA